VTASPNLLLITTDQQRFDTLEMDFLHTPHLDQLRHQGVHFRRAYAETPICVPARVSIMTGRGVFEHGMTHNGASSAVMGRDGTLPALLRETGYATAAIGKLHFTPQRARHGFDETVLPDDYYRSMAGQPWQPMRHGLGQNELHPGMATVPEALTLTAWIADQCVQYIRERRDPTVPFFLWASFSKPHPPLDPPEPYASMYLDAPVPEPVCGAWAAADGDACPPAFARQRQRGSFDLVPISAIRAARAAYYGLVTQVDYAIGRIFAGLQDVELLDGTLVLFTSDHGEFLGDHRSGNKVMFHEPSARVPFLLRLPAGWPRRWYGEVSDALVTHADVLPTLVAAAGGTPPPGCTGLDLLALLRGETSRDHLYGGATEAGYEEPIYLAVTDGRWKYIWYPEGGHQQLFDLATDPQELADVCGERPSVADSLHDTLVRRLRALGSRWVTGDRLVSVPLRGDSVADRRASGWPGYHTEYHPSDVRH
jgi:arylsulfatase A-like enzyme